MNILITGVFGFIGQSLYKNYKKKNNVKGIGRKKKKEKFKNSKNLIKKSISLANLTKIKFRPDIIFHCAGSGSVSESNKNKKRDYYCNVKLTKQLFEYANSFKKKPIIYFFSSAAVYGNSINKINPISAYGKNKFLGEKLSLKYSKEFEISLVILRLFSVYGEGNRKQLFWDICKKIQKKNDVYFGTGEEIRSWLHIKDLIKAINKLLKIKKFPLIIDLGSFRGIKNKQIIQYFYKIFHLNRSIKFNGIKKSGDPFKQISNNRKIKKLGWKPQVDIYHGIKNYAKWFKKN